MNGEFTPIDAMDFLSQFVTGFGVATGRSAKVTYIMGRRDGGEPSKLCFEYTTPDYVGDIIDLGSYNIEEVFYKVNDKNYFQSLVDMYLDDTQQKQ